MKVLLFGTGYFYRLYRHWFPDEDVVALLDNSAAKQGQVLDGKRIVSPTEGVQLSFDAVFVLSMYYREMRDQLVALGVPAERIYGIFDICHFVQEDPTAMAVQKFAAPRKRGAGRPRLALLSYDLRRNGASFAALYAAEVLADSYEVTVLSTADGPLREPLLQAGIDVWVAPVLQIATRQDLPWLSEFQLLLCNTFNWYYFLSQRDVAQPVLWWLHDAACYYELVDHKVLRGLDRRGLTVAAVGPMARQAAQPFLPDVQIKDMLYGLPDARPASYVPSCSKRVRFAVVGMVQVLKGQDLFIDAIRQLPAQFLIVGDDTSTFAAEQRQRCTDMPEVEFTGELDRQSLLQLYADMDVLVCSSRVETMSIVVSEAMMFSHPCIVTDHVGAAQYLHDGSDSIIYPVEDVSALATAMQRFIKSPQLAVTMGQRARQVYEKVFGMAAFQQRLCSLVTQIMSTV